ncbi:riboflavin kinase / FMN adenylyltransferase [Sporobacter termitidis DSM 10068]|uniref:Riboflavin biosynthesis protein n=1 Tax=Sporobacter termitidis DSM 10068 TaxID=1123282 RepID=A0A1M5XXM9_9FIRM|nr:bifunctional riboflavin kinase/FAD synthetase [Sporobacter termitidis]SHI04540.1 riboflavin kinase / FMN adenylyltransferase [Sporobacter termitidis DSM 10068]
MTEKKRVIALGFFDGLHIGHSALMERVLKIAKEKDLLPSVITFDNHPASMVAGQPIPLINSCEDRAGLIHRIFGINNVIILHFDKDLMRMPWTEFVERLSNEFNAAYLVAGHDFTFGHKGEGTAEKLAQKSRELGIGCDIIPAVTYKGVVSSSTYIRKLIAEGDIEQANEFLGHPHVLTDIVHYGYRLGRTLGTPTINMCFQAGVIIPAYGVYATRVYLEDGSEHIGVTNVGIRPTVNHTETVTAETYILDYSGNLYGKMVRVEFYKRLRPEIKFSGIDALKAQIHADAESARNYFTRLYSK